MSKIEETSTSVLVINPRENLLCITTRVVDLTLNVGNRYQMDLSASMLSLNSALMFSKKRNGRLETKKLSLWKREVYKLTSAPKPADQTNTLLMQRESNSFSLFFTITLTTTGRNLHLFFYTCVIFVS